jgi:hypothetical protein
VERPSGLSDRGSTACCDPARRESTIVMPGKSQSDIAYGFVTISRLDPRFYAYWLMNNILGQFGLGGRLADNIRERQGMAYYAFSSFDPTFGESALDRARGCRSRERGARRRRDRYGIRHLGEGGPTMTESTRRGPT